MELGGAEDGSGVEGGTSEGSRDEDAALAERLLETADSSRGSSLSPAPFHRQASGRFEPPLRPCHGPWGALANGPKPALLAPSVEGWEAGVSAGSAATTPVAWVAFSTGCLTNIVPASGDNDITPRPLGRFRPSKSSRNSGRGLETRRRNPKSRPTDHPPLECDSTDTERVLYFLFPIRLNQAPESRSRTLDQSSIARSLSFVRMD